MKRIAILMVTALMSLAAAAAPIRYFTKSQATRTVRYLNEQRELMICCGYDYEIETYVLLNEVWAERVNSSYYELWVFGYDAYTGEEVYMPLDLQCVWLYSAGRMYSAAQYLRFYTTARVPDIAWYVPAYHPYTRITHRHGYVRTYHYDVHCYGWMPPAPPHGGWGPGVPPPMHPYYMRAPHAPAPRPVAVWTPGVDRPHVTVPDAAGRTDAPRSGATTVTTRPSAQPSGTARTGSTTSRSTGTATGMTRGTTPSRSNTSAAASKSSSASSRAVSDDSKSSSSKLKIENSEFGKSGSRTSGSTGSSSKLKIENSEFGKSRSTTSRSTGSSSKLKIENSEFGKSRSTTSRSTGSSSKLKIENSEFGKSGSTRSRSTGSRR